VQQAKTPNECQNCVKIKRLQNELDFYILYNFYFRIYVNVVSFKLVNCLSKRKQKGNSQGKVGTSPNKSQIIAFFIWRVWRHTGGIGKVS